MRNKNINDIESYVESNTEHYENSDPTAKKGWVKRSFNAVRRAASSVAKGLDSLSESINNSPSMSAAASGSALYAMQKHNMIDTPSIKKNSGASLAFTGVSAVTLGSYIAAENERRIKKSENVEKVEGNIEDHYQEKREQEATIQPKQQVEPEAQPQKQAQPEPESITPPSAENKTGISEGNTEKRGWLKRAADGIKKVVLAIDSVANSVNETMQSSPGMSAATSGSALYGMQKHNKINTPDIPTNSASSLAFTGVSAVTLAGYKKKIDAEIKENGQAENNKPDNNKPKSFAERLKEQIPSENDNEGNKPSSGYGLSD